MAFSNSLNLFDILNNDCIDQVLNILEPLERANLLLTSKKLHESTMAHNRADIIANLRTYLNETGIFRDLLQTPEIPLESALSFLSTADLRQFANYIKSYPVHSLYQRHFLDWLLSDEISKTTSLDFWNLAIARVLLDIGVDEPSCKVSITDTNLPMMKKLLSLTDQIRSSINLQDIPKAITSIKVLYDLDKSNDQWIGKLVAEHLFSRCMLDNSYTRKSITDGLNAVEQNFCKLILSQINKKLKTASAQRNHNLPLNIDEKKFEKLWLENRRSINDVVNTLRAQQGNEIVAMPDVRTTMFTAQGEILGAKHPIINRFSILNDGQNQPGEHYRISQLKRLIGDKKNVIHVHHKAVLLRHLTQNGLAFEKYKELYKRYIDFAVKLGDNPDLNKAMVGFLGCVFKLDHYDDEIIRWLIQIPTNLSSFDFWHMLYEKLNGDMKSIFWMILILGDNRNYTNAESFNTALFLVNSKVFEGNYHRCFGIVMIRYLQELCAKPRLALWLNDKNNQSWLGGKEFNDRFDGKNKDNIKLIILRMLIFYPNTTIRLSQLAQFKDILFSGSRTENAFFALLRLPETLYEVALEKLTHSPETTTMELIEKDLPFLKLFSKNWYDDSRYDEHELRFQSFIAQLNETQLAGMLSAEPLSTGHGNLLNLFNFHRQIAKNYGDQIATLYFRFVKLVLQSSSSIFASSKVNEFYSLAKDHGWLFTNPYPGVQLIPSNEKIIQTGFFQKKPKKHIHHELNRLIDDMNKIKRKPEEEVNDPRLTKRQAVEGSTGQPLPAKTEEIAPDYMEVETTSFNI